ncbi:MAG: pantetheine-phosphate adenylyltransferase [Bradymonadales bacterium]|nr:pantetheine-phosphate adenylyltransferase [Bradymonadales bacterium]
MAGHTAIYPGSFDPITNGHMAIIFQTLKLFDRVIIAVLNNASKKPTFSADVRTELIRRSLAGESRVEVDTFDGLLVKYAQSKKAVAVIRGLRGVFDFDFELQMCNMNRHLAPDLVTVYLMAEGRHSYISSSVLKEVAQLGGDIHGLVPQPVEEHLRRYYNRPAHS